MAEWLGSGLQNRVRWFESDWHLLQKSFIIHKLGTLLWDLHQTLDPEQ